MPYWENVTRSFRIAWRHKYMWLIALFAGEAGSGGGYSYSQGTSNGSGSTSATQFSDATNSAINWLTSHAGLVALIAAVWLVIVIAFFVLGAVCEGATVRAAAEHDAERPFSLGWAWRAGVGTMWAIVRFRLLLFLLYLPFVAIAIGLVLSILALYGGSSVGGGLTGLFALLILLAIPYAIYLFLLDRLGSRAIVLEQVMARAGIVRAHRLLFKRFGRTLLVWLLSIGVAIVVGIAVACILGLVFAPLLLAGFAVGSTNSGAILPLVIIGGLILFAVGLVVQGFLAAQNATYWTLAFRRLDLDYAPAPAYQYPAPLAPPPPPPPAPPPAPA